MMYSNDPTKSRTQRQLVLPEVVHNPNGAPVRRGLYVDCETTGLDWTRDEVTRHSASTPRSSTATRTTATSSASSRASSPG